MSEANEVRQESTVRIARHYRRSVRIDTDVGRTDALEGYVLTDTACEALSVMSRQVAGSNQRAFTWTGPYGGGKSSLAVVLAAAVSANQGLRAEAYKLLSDRIVDKDRWPTQLFANADSFQHFVKALHSYEDCFKLRDPWWSALRALAGGQNEEEGFCNAKDLSARLLEAFDETPEQWV